LFIYYTYVQAWTYVYATEYLVTSCLVAQTSRAYFYSFFSFNLLTYTPFPYLFFVLAIALFIYYTSVPTGTEARTEVK